MEKYRSLAPEYTQWIIKEYKHWTLLLHEDQRYLGRAYAWLVREGGMQRLSGVTEEEYAEMQLVMREYEAAMDKLWQPDFMNYAWLANHIHMHGGHGHLHLIPRYEKPRMVDGVEFVDGRWGKNYAPNEAFVPDERVMIQVLEELKGLIP